MLEDYCLRKMKIKDYVFLCECFEDFPIGRVNMREVQGIIDYCAIKDFIHGNILEYCGVPVGFRLTCINNKTAEVRLDVIHPEYRGLGHASANLFLHGKWYFETLELEDAYGEIVNSKSLNDIYTKWKDVSSMPQKLRKCREIYGDKDLNYIFISKSDFYKWVDTHPLYCNIT